MITLLSGGNPSSAGCCCNPRTVLFVKQGTHLTMTWEEMGVPGKQAAQVRAISVCHRQAGAVGRHYEMWADGPYRIQVGKRTRGKSGSDLWSSCWFPHWFWGNPAGKDTHGNDMTTEPWNCFKYKPVACIIIMTAGALWGKSKVHPCSTPL